MLCTEGELSQRGVQLGSRAIRTARAHTAACTAWGHPPAWHLQPAEASAHPLWVQGSLPQQRGKAAASACACPAVRSCLLVREGQQGCAPLTLAHQGVQELS